MAAGIGIGVKVTGTEKTMRALESLARQSPAAARRAVNRTIGVARQRVIKSVSKATGINQRVLGGARGRGYIKQVKASRRRAQGALVGLVEGVRFANLRRKRIGSLKRKPGGIGAPFAASLRSGHASLFERHPPMLRTSGSGRTPNTARKNLPIREVVIPIEPHAGRAIRVHMRRAARTVYPRKLWEELQKRIKPAR